MNAPSFGVLFAFVMAILLLFVSGFASASEIAFFSLSPSDVSELEQSKTKKDKHISMLREDNERTLATILIGNNFVNVTIIMLCNYAFGNLISFGAKAYWLQFLSLTVILTFLLLLFGEIIPKVYSRQNPLAYCRVSVGGIMFMRRLFWPLETILIKSGIFLEKMVHKENQHLSMDDLEQALELTDKNEIKDEKSILQGIIRFGDETAKEIMTSRQDIVDIDIRSSFSEVMSCILENNYSRIPVYQDNDDNIRGILYIKDLLPHVSKPANFRWQSLIRSGYFVPETKKIIMEDPAFGWTCLWNLWNRKYLIWAMLMAYKVTGEKDILDSVRRQMDQWIDMMHRLGVSLCDTGSTDFLGVASMSVLKPLVMLWTSHSSNGFQNPQSGQSHTS